MTAAMSPDRRIGKHRVAKRMIPMPMGIDHPTNGTRGEGTDVRGEFEGGLVALSRVDDQHSLVADHRANVQRQELVLAPERAVCDSSNTAQIYTYGSTHRDPRPSSPIGRQRFRQRGCTC